MNKIKFFIKIIFLKLKIIFFLRKRSKIFCIKLHNLKSDFVKNDVILDFDYGYKNEYNNDFCLINIIFHVSFSERIRRINNFIFYIKLFFKLIIRKEIFFIEIDSDDVVAENIKYLYWYIKIFKSHGYICNANILINYKDFNNLIDLPNYMFSFSEFSKDTCGNSNLNLFKKNCYYKSLDNLDYNYILYYLNFLRYIELFFLKNYPFFNILFIKTGDDFSLEFFNDKAILKNSYKNKYIKIICNFFILEKNIWVLSRVKYYILWFVFVILLGTFVYSFMQNMIFYNFLRYEYVNFFTKISLTNGENKSILVKENLQDIVNLDNKIDHLKYKLFFSFYFYNHQLIKKLIKQSFEYNIMPFIQKKLLEESHIPTSNCNSLYHQLRMYNLIKNPEKFDSLLFYQSFHDYILKELNIKINRNISNIIYKELLRNKSNNAIENINFEENLKKCSMNNLYFSELYFHFDDMLNDFDNIIYVPPIYMQSSDFLMISRKNYYKMLNLKNIKIIYINDILNKVTHIDFYIKNYKDFLWYLKNLYYNDLIRYFSENINLKKFYNIQEAYIVLEDILEQKNNSTEKMVSSFCKYIKSINKENNYFICDNNCYLNYLQNIKFNDLLNAMHDFLNKKSNESVIFTDYIEHVRGKDNKENLFSIIKNHKLMIKYQNNPIDKWFYQYLNNLSLLLGQSISHYINDIWNNQIYRYYFVNYNKFKNTNNKVVNFYNDSSALLMLLSDKNLNNFINNEFNPLSHISPSDLLKFSWSDSFIRFYQAYLFLKQACILDSNNQMGLYISIKPLYLSSRSEGFYLTEGHSVLSYLHGRQNWLKIFMPISTAESTAQLIIKDFNGRKLILNYKSSFALLHLLQQGEWQPNVKAHDWLWTYNNAEHKIVLEVKYKPISDKSLIAIFEDLHMTSNPVAGVSG